MPQHFLSEISPISYLLMSVVGWVKRNTKLKSKSQSTGVYFSLDKEPENKIPEIIRSAHIGLALYHLEYLI